MKTQYSVPGTNQLEVFGIHIANPDFVSIKTGIRQLTSRLELELEAVRQWSALAGNRGIKELSSELGGVTKALESAIEEAEKASGIIFEMQKEASHDHE
ncbi:MAG: hypothetical protein JXA49_01675 [Actinobacteria bacterium]|nr:hypothetical protein [Actinomycetota bacterium]